MPRATFILAAAAGLAISGNVSANDITWLNTSGGPFATAANWSPAQVPGPTDRAIFSRSSSYSVQLNGLGHTNSQILVNNDIVQFNLGGANYSLISSASLSVGGGTIIIIGGHPMGIVGDFRIESSAANGLFNSVNTYIGGNGATVLGGSGNINVYGNVTWHNSGLILVGGGAPGTLNILGSGDVTSQSGIIGQTAAGTATVDGSGSTWTMSSTLDVGGNHAGTLNVTNGGLVHNASSIIAVSPGVTGAANVSGSASRWENTGSLFVGNNGSGTLEVLSGGYVASNAGAGNSSIADGPGSHGSLMVSGANSRWLNTGSLKIGGQGTATVDIGGGGLLDSSGTTYLGWLGGSATVTVSGAGATWNTGGPVYIGGNQSGAAGTASVTIGSGAFMNTGATAALNVWNTGSLTLNGGTVSLGSLNAAPGTFAWNSGTLYFQSPLLVTPGGALGPTPSISTGRTIHAGLGIEIDATTNPTMSVPGGVVNSDSTLAVGDATHGTLNLSAGALLNTPNFIVGGGAAASGVVHVDGAGSLWHQGVTGNFDDVFIGNAGTGTLQVTGGAEVVIEHNPVDLGNLAGGHGSALVSGQNSLLQLEGYFLSIGREGTGSVDVQSGGQVMGDAIVAEVTGSGSVGITGAGSAWTANSFTLGHGGPGVLDISSGGSLSIGDLYMADGSSGSATATVSGAGSSLTATPGNGAGGQFSIGGMGPASLTISSGAHATAYESFVGDGNSAVGTLTIRDAGSTLASLNELDAGFNGNGTILIQSGATASTLTANIGRFPGSTGLVNVDGAASALNVGSQMYVGGGTSGRVNITNSGAVHTVGPATVNATGTIALTSSSLSALYVALNGGALQGTGTVAADINNSGSVSPGNSPGLLTIQGAYSQTAAGALNVELGGTTAGTQYDRIAISGAAALGGTLNISLVNGYIPHGAETFTILTASSISGFFSTVHLPTLPGGSLRVVYGPTSISLAFCYANCDGSTTAPTLNINDFVCFLNKFAAGDPYANCDASTGAPTLNVNDFNCFLNRFAAGCP